MERPSQWFVNTNAMSSDGSLSSQGANVMKEEPSEEEALLRQAKMYQDYIMNIPIPTVRGSVIPFLTWTGLGRSMKQMYNQPLHYLTNVLLKKWDNLRAGAENEREPLDFIIHPVKAETQIWLIEEMHRLTTSYVALAEIWEKNPMYHADIDSIIPDLG